MAIERRHAERFKTRGIEVQDKLKRLKGRSEAGLVPDRARGPASPLGKRKIEERAKR